MSRLAFSLLLLSGWCATLCAEEVSYGQHDPGVPELAVLEHFVGKWDGRLQGSEEVIHATRKWVLSGKFIKHDFDLASGGLSGTIYRGYDRERNRYTMVMVDSQGTVSLLAGYWSETLKTLTFESVDVSCPIKKYESYFPDDQTEQWTITTQGENSAELHGTAKKQP